MNPKLIANKIVVSCENEDPRGLVESVDQLLTYKLSTLVEEIQEKVGKELFTKTIQKAIGEEKEDTYESYEKDVQEAIDLVIESVLESRKDLEKEIKKVSEKKKVSESEVKKYFKESGILEDKEVSTKETNQKNQNDEKMNDQDETKTIQNESFMASIENGGPILFTEGKKYVISREEGKAFCQIFNNLNEENKSLFVENLTTNRQTFLTMLKFTKSEIG